MNKKSKKINKNMIILVLFIIIVVAISVAIKMKNQGNSALASAEEKRIAEEQRIEEEKKKKEEEERIERERKEQEEKAKKEKEKAEEQNATGVIYLTFDDGPSADSTPQILDILKANDIKATFFVLHYSEENEHLIKREQAEGHKIALHGYSHTYSEIYKSADTALNNFMKIQNQVYQTTGEKSNIIRFPGGSSNTVSRKYCPGVMTELTKKVVENGFRYFDWNVDSGDATKPKNSDVVYNNFIKGLKPNRNNVVLMHDFTKNTPTIGALQRVIDYGKQNGYVFRKISDETPMVTHSVNN